MTKVNHSFYYTAKLNDDKSKNKFIINNDIVIVNA